MNGSQNFVVVRPDKTIHFIVMARDANDAIARVEQELGRPLDAPDVFSLDEFCAIRVMANRSR